MRFVFPSLFKLQIQNVFNLILLKHQESNVSFRKLNMAQINNKALLVISF